MNLDDEDDTELVMDWIHDFEKMYSLNAQYPREKMNKLTVYYLYVENGFITRMVPKNISLGFLEPFGLGFVEKMKQLGYEGLSGFTKQRMLETTEMISSNEIIEKECLKMDQKRFVLSEMMLFNMDIVPEKIASFSEGSSFEIQPFFKTFSCFVSDGGEDIWGGFEQSSYEWGDSVFIFHCVNAVYFVYYLDDVQNKKVDSILVWNRSGVGSGGKNKTKRVHFPEDLMDSDSESDSSSESDVESFSESSSSDWGKGKWLRKRKHNRTKKIHHHVLSSSMIKQLFS